MGRFGQSEVSPLGWLGSAVRFSIPGITPLALKVCIRLKPLGIAMPMGWGFSALGGMEMIVNSTPPLVVITPSIAANLTGWLVATSRLWLSPVTNINAEPTNASTTPIRRATPATSRCRFRRT